MNKSFLRKSFCSKKCIAYKGLLNSDLLESAYLEIVFSMFKEFDSVYFRKTCKFFFDTQKWIIYVHLSGPI